MLIYGYLFLILDIFDLFHSRLCALCELKPVSLGLLGLLGHPALNIYNETTTPFNFAGKLKFILSPGIPSWILGCENI